MISNSFSYDDDFKKTEKFGIAWYACVQSDMTDSFFSLCHLKNNEFGEFIISQKALDSIAEVNYYKVLSLIFEQKINKNIYYITLAEEKDKLQWRDDSYIYLSLDDFLNRFPRDLFEKQHRSLLSLYKMYPDYGQQMQKTQPHVFFAKNKIESGFIIGSMVNKGWVSIGVKKDAYGEPQFSFPFIITDNGWLEIEEAIKQDRKKQVFIAMKFKDMNNIHNTIRKAIVDASFSPLRIDEKEHINQISSEIQYEITQSGLVVADVTGQNQGVYFEAGYAMGLNIPVIWTCDEKEKNEIHFDIRQYNTILWKDEEDLYERLKKRIIAIMGLRGDE